MKIKTLLLFVLMVLVPHGVRSAGPSAATIAVNFTNQSDFKITITKRAVSWPKDVVEFRFECPTKLNGANFDCVSLDLVDAKKEFYFRSPIATSNKNGSKVGFFMIHQSKIKDCIGGISYSNKSGDLTVYTVDLASFTNLADSK